MDTQDSETNSHSPRLIEPLAIKLHNRRVIVGPDPNGGEDIGIWWKRLEGREVKSTFVRLSREAAEATTLLLIEALNHGHDKRARAVL